MRELGTDGRQVHVYLREKVTLFFSVGVPPVFMAEGSRSSQSEGVGDERRVDVVLARELMGLMGECVEAVVLDDARENRRTHESSDWIWDAARV